MLRVEGRNAHQPMNSLFGFQIAKGVVARHCHGYRSDAGIVRGLEVEDFRLVATPFRPTQVHAQQHVRPVRSVRPAGAGVDGEDCIARIVLSSEQSLELGIRQGLVRLGKLAKDLLSGLVVLGFLSQLEEHLRVLYPLSQLLDQGELSLHGSFFPQELLRPFAVFPQVGSSRRLVQGFLALR